MEKKNKQTHTHTHTNQNEDNFSLFIRRILIILIYCIADRNKPGISMLGVHEHCILQ